MQWLDDMKTQFVTNFTRNIVCHFTDGDAYRNASTGAMTNAQPTDIEWVRFTGVGGSTFNATIGTAASRLKRQPFNIVISVFVPRTRSFNATNGAKYIIDDLDTAMFFDDLTTADIGCIQMNQEEPKTVDYIYGDSGDIWNQINVTYQYFYQYI